MACCHDVWDSADSKPLGSLRLLRRCSTFYRLLSRKEKKNLSISKVLLHCHTVEPVQNAVICNVPGHLHSGCIGFMIMVHVP